MKPSKNKFFHLSLAVVCFFLFGCKKNISSYVEKATKKYAEKNYIETIDNLNVGLLHWNKSDGDEIKAQAYQLLGRSYHGLYNYDKAIEAYREAIKLSTRTFDSAYQLGIIYLTRNQPDVSMDFFQKALKMKTDDPWALLGLANSYFSLNRLKDAQFIYQRIIDVSPAVREALESLSQVKSKIRAPAPPSKKTSEKYKAASPKKENSRFIRGKGLRR
jgi:tetratricopeptide (TPR) repeat protein